MLKLHQSLRAQATVSTLPSLSDADDLQAVTVSVFDPLDALQLGVHHEGPALARGKDGGVLTGHPVGRQPLVLPRGNVGIISEQGQGVQVRGHWDRNLTHDRMKGFSCSSSSE